jgi:predicted RNA-binding protein with PIN domain
MSSCRRVRAVLLAFSAAINVDLGGLCWSGSSRLRYRALHTRPRPSHVLQTTQARKRKQQGSASGNDADSEFSDEAGPSRRFSRKISLRQQLRQLREQAAHERRLAARSTSQSFRRRADRSAKKNGLGEDATEQGSEEGDARPDARVSKSRVPAEPLRQRWLLIDGYNVIGAVPELYAHVQNGDSETARRLLINDVTNLSAMRGWRCSVVFDSKMNPQSGMPRTRTTTERIETNLIGPEISSPSYPAAGRVHRRKPNRNTDALQEPVEVIFPACKSADSYIINRAREVAHRQDVELWAATSDGIVQNLVRASGAYVISTDLFLREMESAKTEMRVIHRLASSEPSLVLIDCLDEESRRKLENLQDRVTDVSSGEETTDAT